MFVPGRSLTKAREIAQLNADRTQSPRYIFTDTNGNIRIEMLPPKIEYEMIEPKMENEA